jgi:hypothetical protein
MDFVWDRCGVEESLLMFVMFVGPMVAMVWEEQAHATTVW